MKLQRYDEAIAELRRAAELAGNSRDRALLLDRVATCERARGTVH
jgi:predicted RNA polymerase sigma factor